MHDFIFLKYVIRKGFLSSEMSKQAILEILLFFNELKISTSTHRLNAISETPEFEKCIRLVGDISNEDTFLNKAINQQFKVCCRKAETSANE